MTQSDGSIPVVKYAVFSITNPEMNIANRSWIAASNAGILTSGSGQNAPFLAEFLPVGASAAQWEILTGDAALDNGYVAFNPLSVSQPGNDYYTWAADVSALYGYYQFKITTQCNQPVNGGTDAGLYSFTSPILTGLIDFQNPSVYGTPVPSVGQTWSPGGEISITFDETVSCGNLLFGAAALSAPTLALLEASENVTQVAVSATCSGNTIDVVLTGSPNWTLLSGAYMAVAIQGVTDVAGNPTADTSAITWSFPIAVYDATHSTVDLSNLAFFPNTAQLQAAVDAARASYNATSQI